MYNNLCELPDNINITVTKSDLYELVDFCLKKNKKQEAKQYPQHLSIKQLSEYINYSEPAIYKMVAQAEIPTYKINGKLLFKRDEVDSWLLNFRQPTIKERIDKLNSGRAKR